MARTTWRLKLREQRELRTQGMTMLFRRTQLLTEIYKDKEYQDDCARRCVEPLDELDAEVSDTALDASVLMAVLEYFTKEEEWKKGNIQMMAAEVIEARRPPKEQPRIGTKWKEEIAKLKAENERLKQELEIASARIDELEKVVKMLGSKAA